MLKYYISSPPIGAIGVWSWLCHLKMRFISWIQNVPKKGSLLSSPKVSSLLY